MFGAEHLFILTVAAVSVVMLLRWTERLPPSKARLVLCWAAVLVPTLEFGHSAWLYATGCKRLVKLLPLHLCGVQSIFIPLAVFTDRDLFKDFIYATSMLGGIFGILFPAGVADYYPAWSYQTIQTVLLHSLLIFVPIALIRTGRHRPDPHRFPRVMLLFLCLALVVGAVDAFFGENYMFLFAPPAGTPLVWVFDTFGRQIYLLITFLLLAGVSFLIHLPFVDTPHPAEERVGRSA